MVENDDIFKMTLEGDIRQRLELLKTMEDDRIGHCLVLGEILGLKIALLKYNQSF